MMRMVIIFVGLWGLVVGGLGVWRELSGKQKWSIVKTAGYGLCTALITFLIVYVVVTLF